MMSLSAVTNGENTGEDLDHDETVKKTEKEKARNRHEMAISKSQLNRNFAVKISRNLHVKRSLFEPTHALVGTGPMAFTKSHAGINQIVRYLRAIGRKALAQTRNKV